MSRPGLAKCEPASPFESVRTALDEIEARYESTRADFVKVSAENLQQCDDIFELQQAVAALKKERDELLATLTSVQASWSQQEIELSNAREVIAELQAMNVRGREDVSR